MLNWIFTKTPLVFLVQNFWRDEAFSFLLANKNIGSIIALTVRDFNPPLYYVILHFWIKLFGQSEIAIRSLSLCFYWGTIFVAFLFLHNVFRFNLKKSFGYLILFVINPILLYYAFEARMYTMFAFFAILSFYFFYQKKPKAYVAATALGLYTHYFMIFVVLTQAVYILLSIRHRGNYKRQVKAVILSTALFLPWLIFLLFQKNLGNGSFWIDKINWQTIADFTASMYTGYEKNFRFYDKNIGSLSWVLLIIILLGLWRYIKDNIQNRRQFLFFLLWFIVPSLTVILVSVIKPLVLPRYLIFISISIIFLIILSLEKIKPYPRILIFLLLIFTTFNYDKNLIAKHRKSNLKQIVNEIKSVIDKDDIFCVESELDFFTAQYYFGENKVCIIGKTYEELPDYVGKVLIPEDKLVSSLPVYPKKAFILKSDGSYVIQAVY